MSLNDPPIEPKHLCSEYLVNWVNKNTNGTYISDCSNDRPIICAACKLISK